MNNHLVRLLSSKKMLNVLGHRHVQYLTGKSYCSSVGPTKMLSFISHKSNTFKLIDLMPRLPSITCRHCSSQNLSQHKLLADADVKVDKDTVRSFKSIQEDEKERVPQSITKKYKPFEDNQRIIQDIIDEQWNPMYEEEMEAPTILYKRGKSGVFDLKELCDLLTEERATDLCVIQIPKEMDYADHMVIVTARSPKHMFALATFMRKRFKSKDLKSTDRLPRIEGTVKSDDWIALDVGNIILHVFMQETRDIMSLEILWTVGSKYDDLTHKKDTEIVQLLNLFQ